MTAALVCLGETLAVFDAVDDGPLRRARRFALRVAGAEFNVAIGAARLGTPVAYLGRVGDDEPGRLIRDTLRAEGVEVSGLLVNADAPTALMVKEHRVPGVVGVTYHRAGSAGSTLSASDVEPSRLAGARVLHITGITPALSRSARRAAFAAAEAARRSGTLVSFDVNHRARLWTAAEAKPVLLDLLPLVDIVFASREEAELLTGHADPEDSARALAESGPCEVVVKMGVDGAVALTGSTILRQAAVPAVEVDPTGAGDAFDAGYLAELIAGADLPQRLATAVRTGAFAVTQRGDWEGAPTRRELRLLEQSSGTVLR